jgi:MFS family permease
VSELVDTRPDASKTLMSAQVSVAVTFIAEALLFASWTAHIPHIKSELGLSDGALGTALLGAPIGSVTAMVLSSRLLPRWGSRRMIRITIVGYGAGGVCVGLADSTIQLFAALAFWGLFQGALDVAMNTQAVTVEKAVGTPIMSRLHGMWSIGGFLGALAGTAAVAFEVDLAAQTAALGIVAIVVIEVLSRSLIPDGRESRKPLPTKRTRRPSAIVLTLGGVAFASMLCEGAVADWSANYLRNELGAGAAFAGLGYAAYALAMVAMRLSGTVWQRRFANTTVLPVLAMVFALGTSVAFALGQPIVALAGFAAMGIGLALIVPSAFSAAGAANDSPANAGSAIATVAALGWLGYVSGPPLIGHLADLVGLGAALWLLPLLAVVIAVITRRSSAFASSSVRN